MFAPVEAEPPDVPLHRLDELGLLGVGVGVVEPEVAATTGMLGGDSEVEAERFRVPDVEEPVRFRWKTSHYASVVLPGL